MSFKRLVGMALRALGPREAEKGYLLGADDVPGIPMPSTKI